VTFFGRKQKMGGTQTFHIDSVWPQLLHKRKLAYFDCFYLTTTLVSFSLLGKQGRST